MERGENSDDKFCDLEREKLQNERKPDWKLKNDRKGRRKQQQFNMMQMILRMMGSQNIQAAKAMLQQTPGRPIQRPHDLWSNDSGDNSFNSKSVQVMPLVILLQVNQFILLSG